MIISGVVIILNFLSYLLMSHMHSRVHQRQWQPIASCWKLKYSNVDDPKTVYVSAHGWSIVTLTCMIQLHLGDVMYTFLKLTTPPVYWRSFCN